MGRPHAVVLPAFSGRERAIAMSRWQLVALLGALSMFAPLSTDMYLPALPSMTHSLHASASALQLTLTSSMLGLGGGQLLAGPMSDAYGRRAPVLVGLVLYIGSSVGCALCNDVWTLAAVRLVQGAAGAAGIVVARAIVRDLFEGSQAARLYSRLMIVMGLAPILAPIAGGQLLHVTDWRGIFITLAAIGALLLVASLRGLHETLPPEFRHRGGGVASVRILRDVLGERRFARLTVIQGLCFITFFAYIAGSSFAVENVFGVSPQLFGVTFGVNAVGLVIASQVGARFVGRVGSHALATLGLGAFTAAAVALLAAVLAGAGLWPALLCLFVLVASYGVIAPNLTALGMEIHPRTAGSASALIGSIQFCAGAVIAPLVGIAGTHSAVPMAIVIAAGALLALALWESPDTSGDRGGPYSAPHGQSR
jgi:DHA1 family bicyclomycin/chloramphenicol resistance-like MFS transporter